MPPISLWRLADLPHGYIPTESHCSSVGHAKDLAEKDAGTPLRWEQGRPLEDGQLTLYSQHLPYKDGKLFYAIWGIPPGTTPKASTRP